MITQQTDNTQPHSHFTVKRPIPVRGSPFINELSGKALQNSIMSNYGIKYPSLT